MMNFTGKSVLIVDDEQDLRELLAEEFEYLGFQTYLAGNGDEALKIFQNKKLDIILSDIRMPDKDGIELLREVRELDKRKPIFILMSGFSENRLAESYDAGVNAVLNKPIKFDLLLNSIEALLAPSSMGWSRRGERKSINGSVKLKLKSMESALKCSLINFGLGGMFISTEEQDLLPVDSVFNFSIQFEAGEPLHFEGVGVVRWARADQIGTHLKGMGVEFVELSSENKVKIFKIIEYLKPKSFIPIG